MVLLFFWLLHGRKHLNSFGLSGSSDEAGEEKGKHEPIEAVWKFGTGFVCDAKTICFSSSSSEQTRLSSQSAGDRVCGRSPFVMTS